MNEIEQLLLGTDTGLGKVATGCFLVLALLSAARQAKIYWVLVE